jgi:hypothetical protein
MAVVAAGALDMEAPPYVRDGVTGVSDSDRLLTQRRSGAELLL